LRVENHTIARCLDIPDNPTATLEFKDIRVARDFFDGNRIFQLVLVWDLLSHSVRWDCFNLFIVY